MNAIETVSLTKKFGDKTAVDALELTVRKGELFSLLGVNGAGKTTTVKMLSGLLSPTSGDALLMGKSIVSQPPEVKRLINVSPQETAVAPNLTVRENLEFMAGIYGSSRHEARKNTDEIIERLHLGETEKSRARTLSGGWQRRLSIAMALITSPEILFLDEPTLGLDVLARRELWRIIEELKGDMTVILTTHYMQEAQELSDRVGIMANGQLKICGTANEILTVAGENDFENAFVKLAGGEAQ